MKLGCHTYECELHINSKIKINNRCAQREELPKKVQNVSKCEYINVWQCDGFEKWRQVNSIVTSDKEYHLQNPHLYIRMYCICISIEILDSELNTCASQKECRVQNWIGQEKKEEIYSSLVDLPEQCQHRRQYVFKYIIGIFWLLFGMAIIQKD